MNEHIHPVFRKILNDYFNATANPMYAQANYEPLDDEDDQYGRFHQQELERRQQEYQQVQ